MKLSAGFQGFLQWALVVAQLISASYMPDEKSRMVSCAILSYTQKYLAGEGQKRDQDGNRLPDPKAPPVEPPPTVAIDSLKIEYSTEPPKKT